MSTTGPSVFSNILVASQIEEAAIVTLHKWFPTYLREIERQIGIDKDTLRNPHNYTNRNSFDTLPGEELPKVVVIAPGTVGTPDKQGNSQYRALWSLGVGVATAAKDEILANMYVKCYGAAVRAIIEQNARLESDLAIAEIHWVSETYPDLPITDQLQLYKAANVEFVVDIDNVVTRWAGPSEPTEQPEYTGIVEKVIVQLNKIPLEDDISG